MKHLICDAPLKGMGNNGFADFLYNVRESIWRVWLTAFALPVENENEDQQEYEQEDCRAHGPTSY